MKTIVTVAFVSLVMALAGRADDLLTMGVTALRTAHPGLTGAGITVGQAEATGGVNNWEANPGAAGQLTLSFSWINTNGSSSVFPNTLGTESEHADEVANYYYGTYYGVAPGVLQVDNYEADYFYELFLTTGTAIAAQVLNQSFIFTGSPPQTTVDSQYDDYIAQNGTIICSSIGFNGIPPAPAGTSYDGLGVGSYGLSADSAAGPTQDNGRSKPDLVAPGSETSFTSPYVAGAAALLLQSAAQGDGGANTSAAEDVRTIKALLLNGTIKPGDWTHTPTAPLDRRYGAGVLNVYYSQQQLTGGQHVASAATTVSTGAAHPPGAPTSVNSALLGWDYATAASNPLQDAVNHYYFDNSANPAPAFTLTATLVWNRDLGQTAINNLSLFLYNTATGTLLTNSVSTVDNVQHIYIPNLPRGKYDLQVVKSGGLSELTPSETYALAFQFYPITPPALALTNSAGAKVVSWPASPTIFNLQQTTSLTPPISWSAVSTVGLLTNATVAVTLTPSSSTTFYRLIR